MSRIFSVIRRRPSLVDIVTPFVYGVDLYRLKWAVNFDTAVPTAFIDAPNIGYIDDAVDRNTLEVHQTRDMVRIVFDPNTFSIPDNVACWLQLARVVGGLETIVSPPTLLLPDAAHHGVGVVVIAGTAPSGLSVANSLQIDLPRLMSDIRFVNMDSGRVLYVATEPGGVEIAIHPSTSVGATSLTLQGTESTLLVRGDGAAVDFSAALTLSFPR